jgi:hypothetical protein
MVWPLNHWLRDGGVCTVSTTLVFLLSFSSRVAAAVLRFLPILSADHFVFEWNTDFRGG